MRKNRSIAAVIPALNEEETIGQVIENIPSWVDHIVVVDNGSTDQTARMARQAGAHVIEEKRRGYGRACLAGTDLLATPEHPAAPPRIPDVVVFLDADFSDDPAELPLLIDPILDDTTDFVIGSRTSGKCERGALTTTQRFGNWLSCRLIKRLFEGNFSDLGPFRAVRYSSFKKLAMDDTDYGWTVQMQIRALRRGLRTTEVPVSYRRRAGGKSKVSGTLRGIFGAGTTILRVVFQEAIDEWKNPSRF